MKKLGISILVLLLATGMLAQDKSEGKSSLCSVLSQKNILSHLDVGLNVGTLGIGIDVAAPIGDYVRVRAGYNYMPRFCIHSDFPVVTRSGNATSTFLSKFGRINQKLTEYGIDINWPDFREEKELMEQFTSGDFETKDYVSVGMKPNIHQFKFLVDVMPFKNNRHWTFTAGFFVGPQSVADASSLEEETAILKAVNLYNRRYYKDYILADMYFKYTDGNGTLHNAEINSLTSFVKENGMAGFNLGSFADGDKAMMVPNEDNTVRAEMEVNKFRPYVGFGYNTSLSRNKKWNLNVDAGIMFLCGKPKVFVDNIYKFNDSKLKGHLDEFGGFVYESGLGYVKQEGFTPDNWEPANPGDKFEYDYDDEYYGEIVRFYYDSTHDPNAWYGLRDDVQKLDHVDLVRDLHDIPGKVGSMVNTISKFKVYPNISIGVSYRIF